VLLSTCGDVCKLLSRCGDVGANCSNQLARRALDESLERLQVRGWSELLHSHVQVVGANSSSSAELADLPPNSSNTNTPFVSLVACVRCTLECGWVGLSLQRLTEAEALVARSPSLTCLQAVPCKQSTLRFQGSVALSPTSHTSVYLQPLAQIQGVQRGWRHKWSSLWKE
jgi:hypothetical protein